MSDLTFGIDGVYSKCLSLGCDNPVAEGENTSCWRHAGGSLRDDLPPEPQRYRPDGGWNHGDPI